MADILTLAQARTALGWKEGQNLDRDADLEDIYIPTVTSVIESFCGRMADRTETWWTTTASPLTTPWTAGTISSVVVVDGATLATWGYTGGVLTISDPAYRTGDRVKVTVSGLPTPPAVVKAGQIILAHLWNADNQGRSPSSVRGENEAIPVGFVMPRRAEALLNPYWHFGGFA